MESSRPSPFLFASCRHIFGGLVSPTCSSPLLPRLWLAQCGRNAEMLIYIICGSLVSAAVLSTVIELPEGSYMYLPVLKVDVTVTVHGISRGLASSQENCGRSVVSGNPHSQSCMSGSQSGYPTPTHIPLPPTHAAVLSNYNTSNITNMPTSISV